MSDRALMVSDGILNVNKPENWTSHDVVAKIKGLLCLKRVGHTGTLDPFATGVLLVCFGRGTKIVSYLMEGEKEYRGVMRLGEERDTLDATVTIIRRVEKVAVSEGEVREVFHSFVGTIEQIPPMYSAVKVRGVPLYEVARRGGIIERSARRVTIKSFEMIGMEGPDISFHVVCSKGTYVRALCGDVGKRLGVGAYLVCLERTRSGPFTIENAMDLEGIERSLREGRLEEEVYSLGEALSFLPSVRVRPSLVHRVKNGAPISVSDLSEHVPLLEKSRVRVEDSEGNLIAIALIVNHMVVIERVL